MRDWRAPEKESQGKDKGKGMGREAPGVLWKACERKPQEDSQPQTLSGYKTASLSKTEMVTVKS
jgi:hypothetical protein